jgi:ssDNA-binding replication factor A large subunit
MDVGAVTVRVGDGTGELRLPDAQTVEEQRNVDYVHIDGASPSNGSENKSQSKTSTLGMAAPHFEGPEVEGLTCPSAH